VRPLCSKEAEETFGWDSDGYSIWPLTKSASIFVVDRVFGPLSQTREIYDYAIRPLIQKVVSGFNATFFAYGQTSSGKTYTIQGTEEEEGAISLAVKDMFALIDQEQSREFLCRASYLEASLDLLQP